jgi:hypothetical protein
MAAGFAAADFLDDDIINFSFDGDSEMVHGGDVVSGYGAR